MSEPLKEKPTDAWARQLADGRIEIMCRTPGFRIRVAAPAEQAWEAVELFEGWTGLQVNAENRPRRAQRQIVGQLDLTEVAEGDQ